MQTKDLDVVYFLREGKNPELVYSLRALERNFPHNRVIFVGGCPEGLKPNLQIEATQEKDKWQNAAYLIKLACEDDRLSEDIVLFNDDFFVAKPIQELPTYVNDNLVHLSNLVTRNGQIKSEYINTRIQPAIQFLQKLGLSVLNYELHVPMIVNRKKMLRIYNIFGDIPAKRSLYGNFYHLGGEEIDPRGRMWDGVFQNVYDIYRGDRTFISTTDDSWKGEIGEQIKNLFPNPSNFEYN